MENSQQIDPCEASITLLRNLIEKFLVDNPTMTAPEFGHLAARDTALVKRLRGGGDVTTRKFHKIVRFIENPSR